ncbi:MAG TPA: hypothetical protein VF647_04520 [Longimicrobium sp.]|jgi:hypothetical protein
MSEANQGKPEDELVSLNADDLDVEELDDQSLEEAAGGCWDMTCGTNKSFEEQQSIQ